MSALQTDIGGISVLTQVYNRTEERPWVDSMTSIARRGVAYASIESPSFAHLHGDTPLFAVAQHVPVSPSTGLILYDTPILFELRE